MKTLQSKFNQFDETTAPHLLLSQAHQHGGQIPQHVAIARHRRAHALQHLLQRLQRRQHDALVPLRAHHAHELGKHAVHAGLDGKLRQHALRPAVRAEDGERCAAESREGANHGVADRRVLVRRALQ